MEILYLHLIAFCIEYTHLQLTTIVVKIAYIQAVQAPAHGMLARYLAWRVLPVVVHHHLVVQFQIAAVV